MIFNEKQIKNIFDAIESTFDFSLIDFFLIDKINFNFLNNYYGVKFFAYKNFLDKDIDKNFDFSQYFINNYDDFIKEKKYIEKASSLTLDIFILIVNKINFNKKQIENIKNEFKVFNFIFWNNISNRINNYLKDKSENNFFELLIFKRKNFAQINEKYFIQKIFTDNPAHHLFFKDENLYFDSFQIIFKKLIKLIKKSVRLNKSFSILRLGDGDYYFLRKIPIGSAKPGRRALTKKYNEIDINIFKKLFWENDILSPEIDPINYRHWSGYLFYDFFDKFLEIFKVPFQGEITAGPIKFLFDKIFGRIISSKIFLKIFIFLINFKKNKKYKKKVFDIINKKYIPMEVVYALVSTKWVFKNYPEEIGLITGGPKLELIKLLSQKKEYCDYLGIKKFVDFIEIPQIGAADNIIDLSKDIGGKIKNSSAKIFLVAAGSSKLALLTLLKNYTNTVIIDIGCGMDAIAGIVCQERPYFANWTNYRIKGYDYSKIDFMDKGNLAWNKKDYLTKYLD